MTTIDWLLAIILLLAFIKGWRSGFLYQLVSFGGLIAGLIMARMLYEKSAKLLMSYWDSTQTVAEICSFMLIWLGVLVVSLCVAHILTKTAELICLGGLNRFAGGVLGVLKYSLFLSCFLYMLTSMRWLDEEKQKHSCLSRPITTTGMFLFRCMKITWGEYKKHYNASYAVYVFKEKGKILFYPNSMKYLK